MKWTIEKNVILEALNNVTKDLSQRTTIPVLNGIVFDVNEKGTEAAAVTVVGIVETSAPVTESVVFKADKPFIYMIQENSTGSILFMGTVKRF